MWYKSREFDEYSYSSKNWRVCYESNLYISLNLLVKSNFYKVWTYSIRSEPYSTHPLSPCLQFCRLDDLPHFSIAFLKGGLSCLSNTMALLPSRMIFWSDSTLPLQNSSGPSGAGFSIKELKVDPQVNVAFSNSCLIFGSKELGLWASIQRSQVANLCILRGCQSFVNAH